MLRSISLVLLCLAFSQFTHAEGQTERPVIYLTFDDGPSGDAVTEKILQLLARHDALATFFVTGARARANPSKIQRIVDAGHALGNHTNSHGRLTTLFDHQIAEELSSTNGYVLAAGGPILNCFRPPFGITNPRVNKIAGRMGLRKVGWTIDTRDWNQFIDVEDISLQLEDAHHGSVVLLHDGPQARWKTLTALTRWMDDVGHLFSFKPLPDCTDSTFDYGLMTVADNTIANDAVTSGLVDTVYREPPVAESIPELIAKLKGYSIPLIE